MCLDPAADLSAEGQGPGEVRRDWRERSLYAAIREALSAPPAEWAVVARPFLDNPLVVIAPRAY